jgi:hypothetical protein
VVNARKEPVPKSSQAVDPHIFAPDLHGPRDRLSDRPIECQHCRFPEANKGVHVTSEELVADLPPTPDEAKKIDRRRLGEAS